MPDRKTIFRKWEYKYRQYRTLSYTFAVSYDWGVIAANLAFFEALEGGVFVDVELAAEVAGGEESDLFMVICWEIGKKIFAENAYFF